MTNINSSLNNISLWSSDKMQIMDNHKNNYICIENKEMFELG